MPTTKLMVFLHRDRRSIAGRRTQPTATLPVFPSVSLPPGAWA